ncbi:MAG: rod shape-determining protein MreD [Acidobacteriaceae bacterium]
MAVLASNFRREMEAPRFPLLITLLVPLLAIFLQAYLPLRFPRLDIFNLPLLITVYFAITRRSPVIGTLTGASIGLIQDGVTHRPFGINGIANTIIGFLAASIGVKIDVDNTAARLFLLFGFTLLYSFLYLLIVHRLMAFDLRWTWRHEVIKAAVNAVLGVLLFALLDRTRRLD